MIPKQIMFNPLNAVVMSNDDAQPLTVLPSNSISKTQKAITRETKKVIIPNENTNLSGEVLNEVTPCHANDNIFLSGYFVSPCKRTFLL